jgi:NADH dehydrogenase FAD-containing subunit
MLGKLTLPCPFASLFNQRCCSVGKVTPESVTYKLKLPSGDIVEKSIPSNFVLWSTGIAMNPFAKRVTDLLPNQVHRKVAILASCTLGKKSLIAVT